MPWGVAAAVVGAGISAYGASQSGATPNTSGGTAAIGEGLKMTNNALNPWIEQGQLAQNAYLNQLGIGPGKAIDVSQLPGFQNSMQQGINAVNQGYAGGGLLGGNAMRALQQSGMSVAGQYYSDYMNRLSQTINQGYGAAQNKASIKANLMSGQASALYQNAQDVANAHNAQAGNIMNLGGAIAGAGMGYASGGTTASTTQPNWTTMNTSYQPLSTQNQPPEKLGTGNWYGP